MPVTWGPNSVTIIENTAARSANQITYAKSISATNPPRGLFTPEELEAKLQASRDKMAKINEKYKAETEGVLPSRIILGALAAVMLMQQLAGVSIPFGGSAWEGSPTYPYQGDCFKEGSQDFTEVVALLKAAEPSNWDGEAADTYTTANSTVVTQAQAMADLDLEMEKLVKSHAEVVSQTQLGIGIEQDVLIVAFPIILALESYWQTFTIAQTSARVTAVAAIGAAVGLLGWCLGTSIQTQQAVDALGYGDVIAALKPVIDAYASASAPVTQPSQSVASPGADVSGGVSASSASPGSDVAPQRSPLNAATGEDQPAGADAPQTGPTADQEAPSTPTVSSSPGSTSGVAQVGQPSRQAANLSGGSASAGNRTNPQSQQVAAEDAAPATDSEDAEAGSGTQGAERAPIDAAAAVPEPTLAPTARP